MNTSEHTKIVLLEMKGNVTTSQTPFLEIVRVGQHTIQHTYID